VPADRAVEWLRALAETWQNADIPEARSELLPRSTSGSSWQGASLCRPASHRPPTPTSKLIGAPDRIRTCDLRLRRPTLYPLSYRRASCDGAASIDPVTIPEATAWPVRMVADPAAGARNYSIYVHGDDLFGVLEVDDFDGFRTAMDAAPVNARWQAEMAALIDPRIDPATGFHRRLDEVFRLD
jgi:L-rhamnose mutarotase